MQDAITNFSLWVIFFHRQNHKLNMNEAATEKKIQKINWYKFINIINTNKLYMYTYYNTIIIKTNAYWKNEKKKHFTCLLWYIFGLFFMRLEDFELRRFFFNRFRCQRFRGLKIDGTVFLFESHCIGFQQMLVLSIAWLLCWCFQEHGGDIWEILY